MGKKILNNLIWIIGVVFKHIGYFIGFIFLVFAVAPILFIFDGLANIFKSIKKSFLELMRLMAKPADFFWNLLIMNHTEDRTFIYCQTGLYTILASSYIYGSILGIIDGGQSILNLFLVITVSIYTSMVVFTLWSKSIKLMKK